MTNNLPPCPYVPVPSAPAVLGAGVIFLSVTNPEPGTPFYVKDVREWLKRVDMVNISDDTEVEGGLYLSYDTPDFGEENTFEPALCGDCDGQDIVLINHSCPRPRS